jgi:hypothetical protein
MMCVCVCAEAGADGLYSRILGQNFTDAEDPVLEITDENREHLRSGYTKRRPEELAVLSRWFDGTRVEKKRAAYLDLILYSREQCIDEKKALPR